MKLVLSIVALGAMTLVGCSSTKKVIKEEVIKTEAPDYVVLESSQATRPSWIQDPATGDNEKEVKKSRYFVNDAQNINQRLCVRSAEARATSKIAREIAQFLKNSYTEATQNDSDEVTEHTEEQLAQESQTFIVGAKTLNTFWEKRRYKVELGATKNKVEYNCFALVKMTKKDIQEAVKKSRQKLLTKIEDPEVKIKAAKALAGAEKAFADLDKPVKLDSEE